MAVGDDDHLLIRAGVPGEQVAGQAQAVLQDLVVQVRVELLVRGQVTMRGYRLDEPATAAAFTPDGFLRTGDLGRVHPDGSVQVGDRRKDVIISGAVNVSPTAVEHVLLLHPAIRDVCVVGLPDPEWGERVVAYVVPVRKGLPPSLADLRAFAQSRLSSAELPQIGRAHV